MSFNVKLILDQAFKNVTCLIRKSCKIAEGQQCYRIRALLSNDNFVAVQMAEHGARPFIEQIQIKGRV